MPYMTQMELTAPGAQPVTRDLPTRRRKKRTGRYHRHPYMLDGEYPMGKETTTFSPLFGYGAEAQMGQIQLIQDIAREIATATGLRDPITHYEPGMKLADVFKKYSGQVKYYPSQVRRLRSATAQGPLLAQLAKLKSLCDRIAPAFYPGAGAVGERDRNRLGELVQGMRDFRKDWHDAKSKYGVGAIPPPFIGPMPPPEAPPKDGLPILPIAIGLLALSVF